MKKFTLLAALVIAAFSVQAQDAVATAAPAQKNIKEYLSFSEVVHDFGKTPYGKAVEFDITIKNISKDSVKIDNVKVGCGCTSPKWQPGPYAPGETFKITLGFNGSADGPFEKYVDLYFSGDLHQQIKFHGTGYKVPENPAPAGANQKMKPAGSN
jgi:hypothetical protein